MNSIQFSTGRSSLNSVYRRQYESSSKLTDRNPKSDWIKINPQELQITIEEEIKKANDVLKQIKAQLQREAKGRDGGLLAEVREMEESIRRKNLQIKELQAEVTMLKGMPNRGIGFSFADEIRNALAGVVELKRELDDKRKTINRRKQQVDITFEKYANKCRNQGTEIIDYMRFKQIQQKKRKDFQRMDRNKMLSKKQMSLIREDRRLEGASSFDRNDNRIKETTNHRNVAEAALKTEKKRHRQEMNNFYSKLDFLKDEEDLLEEKIREKEEELKKAEKRFSESRTKHEVITTGEGRFKGLKLKTLH